LMIFHDQSFGVEADLKSLARTRNNFDSDESLCDWRG
jgi:hypothetical protein